MPQPTPYNRLYNFTDWQTVNPNKPLPGNELDAELNAVKLAADQTQANLALIQRDDGKLANQAVTPDSLSVSTIALIGQGQYMPRGNWATSTLYNVGDVVEFNRATYVALHEHTSNSQFETDDDAGRWLLLANAALSGGEEAVDLFAGDGVTTLFQLSLSYINANAVHVFVNGVAQIPGQDFTLVDDEVTLSVAPPIPSVPGANNIMIRGRLVEAQVAVDQAQAAQSAAEAAAASAAGSASAAQAATGVITNNIDQINIVAGDLGGTGFFYDLGSVGDPAVPDAFNPDGYIKAAVDNLADIQAAPSAAATAQNAIDEFNYKYLGAQSSDPTEDNNGDPLIVGALYFNTVDSLLKIYDGSVWVFTGTGDKGDKGDKGDVGDQGAPGAAATVAVGTVATVGPNDSATVVNSGTSAAAVFDFEIPKGDKGDKGDTGDAGAPGTAWNQWQGAWAAGTYVLNDVVAHNGSSWVVVVASTADEPSLSSSDWDLLAAKGVDGSGSGTVTSVDVSVPTGLEATGGPVTSSGTIAIAFAAGYSIPTNTSQSNWDTAYGWGNHASAGYLTIESDPVFGASAASGITGTQISNWDTAYGWGNHASAGYALSSSLGSLATKSSVGSSDITNGSITSEKLAATIDLGSIA